MCIICNDLEKDKLTSIEARDNLDELHATLAKEHIHEVLQLIWAQEDKEYIEEYRQYDNIHGDTD